MANVGTAVAGKVLTGKGVLAGPGFAFIGTDSGLTSNGVLIANNLSPFTATVAGTNGQVLLGSTGGAPAFGTISSSDGSISFTLGANSLNMTINGGVTVGKTITGDDSVVLSPTAGNWNILGQDAGSISTMDTNGSTSTLRIENRTWTTPLIVDASSTVGLRGTFTTITLAMATAVSGNTIFVRPGTYTENFTWKAGVDIVAYDANALTPNVTIVGKITVTDAGARTMSGIRLQTNSDNILAITGTAASIVRFQNCYLNATNATALNSTTTSTGMRLEIINCSGDLGTTGIAYFTIAHGIINIYNSQLTATGLSTTNSTLSNASSMTMRYSYFQNPITYSSSSTSDMNYSVIRTGGGFDATCLTTSGTGTFSVRNCRLESGTASAASVGTGTILNLTNTTIDSSNTNTVTGLGTLNYSNVTFISSSSVMNTTTQTAQYSNLGKWKASGQPSFLAYLAASALNKTGAGTAYTLGTDALTEVFDQGGDFNTNGTFTAPVTGRYDFDVKVNIVDLTAAMTNDTINLITSNRTYSGTKYSIGTIRDSNNAASLEISVLADMDAADTATCAITISNGAGDTADIQGSATVLTYMSGKLFC